MQVNSRKVLVSLLAAAVMLVGLAGDTDAKKKKKKKDAKQDPYAEYVWPPPPDEARVKLEQVIFGRVDVEARSRLRRKLLGASQAGPYDYLRKPFAVAWDRKERLLVTDSATGALIRFDLDDHRMDVFGTRGAMRLRTPLGLGVGADGTIYVADVGLRKVLAFDTDGKIVAVYGKEGELLNPTDAAVSPDGSRLYVTDSRAHKIVVFDIAGEKLSSFGGPGQGDGDFSFPTSLVFDAEGNLYVVDQINCRIQVFAADGEYLDQLGQQGVGFANFVRPKDVAVDEVGFIYVTDNAYNNVQLFDASFELLTFVGEGGEGPGRFLGASGVAVHGDRFAVVDQLGHRLQIFRFLGAKTQ